uniref:CENP-V/GFA domain-containing protein n=1 Tax=Kwoniella bestiolae CBS 10118 TaxID=1296100 RepID=A0A1B9GC92_9TREE|nr:hypothetical protein I302_00118 [Kwoniella bestiolae CBS 10118]OCF28629.1 hypothetical protein I302_00118 [Kwoniella bestiolae CBS 10118]
MPHVGSCYCGSVTIKVLSTHDVQYACHCEDCKKTTGSAFSTCILPKISDVESNGRIQTYDSKGPSGNIGTPPVSVGTLLLTGNLPDFQTIPFGAELFVRNRFTALPPISGAEQAQTLPSA